MNYLHTFCLMALLLLSSIMLQAQGEGVSITGIKIMTDAGEEIQMLDSLQDGMLTLKYGQTTRLSVNYQ